MIGKNRNRENSIEYDFIREDQMRTEVMPSFVKFLEIILDDEESMIKLMASLGKIIYSLQLRFPNLMNEFRPNFTKFYETCTRSKDAKIRHNSAHYFACMLDLFGQMTPKDKGYIDFARISENLTSEKEELDTR